MKRIWLVGCVLAVVSACGGSDPQTGSLSVGVPDQEPASEAAGFSSKPTALTTNALRDPAVFLGSEKDAATVGYIGDDASVVVEGAPVRSRVPVRVGGGIEFRGWIDARALAAVIQRRGKLKGAPVYVGPGDRVRVTKLRSDGLAELSVSPTSEVLARSGMVLGPFSGAFPIAGLGAKAPTAAEPPRPGTWAEVAAGTQIQIHSEPGGPVVAVLSSLREPLRVAVLRDGDWKGIRLGQGPYLVGFTQAQMTPTETGPAPSPAPTVSSGVPARLQADKNKPLLRVKTGTVLMHGQQPFATVKQRAYAREMGRFDDGFVDVFVAVDGQLSLRGLVPATALEPVRVPSSPVAKPATAPAMPPPTNPGLSPSGGVRSIPQ